MNFKQWINKYINDNNPIGDLARDINQDTDFPSTKQYGRILRYLENKGICDNAKEVFEESFKRYEEEIDKSDNNYKQVDPNEILTLQEAADYLKITRETLTKMVKGAEIKGTKVGREWRFFKGDVIAYMNDNANIKK